MEYKLGNTILLLDKVNIAYGDNLVIKDFSMEEKDVIIDGKNTGQVIAILARSGRGKTTLFKALTGLIKPTSGDILISDNYENNTAKQVSEGNVGFVDQKYTLFRHKTVKQSLLYALRNRTDLLGDKITPSKEELVEEYLEDWNLLPHADKYPNELSGGQRQRVAIIEQLLTSSRYIVFDEPASGLDIVNVEKLKSSFEMISNTNDLNTIIFSTHDINLAVELADSIYVIGHKTIEDVSSSLIAHYDLKSMGLAWKPFGVNHLKLVDTIKNDMRNS